MGSFCCCPLSDKSKEKAVPKTKTGKPINQSILKNFMTQKESNIMKTQLDWNLILCPPFDSFDKITNNLYLTGLGGLREENIRNHNIKHVINVTYELPYYDVPGVESIRITVDDSEEENLFPYFDKISDKINKWSQKQEQTVVHCVSDVSRSTTIVLAYLMKGLSLKDAFEYVYQRREIIRPNNAFLKQLVKYEKKLKKTKGYTKLVMVRTSQNKCILFPEFLIKRFGEKFASNQPMDSTINTSTSQSYLSNIVTK